MPEARPSPYSQPVKKLLITDLIGSLGGLNFNPKWCKLALGGRRSPDFQQTASYTRREGPKRWTPLCLGKAIPLRATACVWIVLLPCLAVCPRQIPDRSVIAHTARYKA